jgi:hypothetical protein
MLFAPIADAAASVLTRRVWVDAEKPASVVQLVLQFDARHHRQPSAEQMQVNMLGVPSINE